ncbi:MAG: molybdopterin molybdotransferase [Halanaerobiales bacterium]|nr:molybdopterin molybdotransferase [Halanaerobiales bacterium]
MERKIYLNKVSLEAALEKYLGLFKEKTLPGERIRVSEARGRVTAEPVYALRTAPNFYASAMDGIAVRAEDTVGASERSPISLREGKEAHWVDTGDPVPEGFNAVIKIEEVNEKESNILEIERGVTPWENVRGIGESVIKGQLVLPVNHQLTPYDIGALLEAGVTEITVRKRPEVGIIPTGTELVPPEEKPLKGQLTEFNSAMLKAYTEEWGGIPSVSEIIKDDYQEIKEKIISVHRENDLTVIIAGSSAGEEDYTVRILQELGRVVVHGVNIMPGKPVVLAVVDEKPVIGIPGYPLAALLNYYIFVRALIYLLSGLEVPETPVVEAVVRRKVPSQIGLREFLRVNLAELDNELIAVPRKRGSAAMESLLRADGVMPIPEQQEGLSPGSRVPVHLLKSNREIKRNLLLVGSHDLTLDILVNKLRERRAGFALNIQSAGSMAGIMALKRGECHLAGAHLLDENSGEYNYPFLKRILPDRKLALVNLVYRQQGLMIKKGNPKNIKGIKDLIREDVIYINRQRGAGTRVLLDYWLKKEGILPGDIKGYGREEYTHISAAAAVAGGSADAALGIMAAARAMDLDFIPLVEERYDLVIPEELLNDWRFEYLIELIKSADFRQEAGDLGGYRLDRSGEIMNQGGELG